MLMSSLLYSVDLEDRKNAEEKAAAEAVEVYEFQMAADKEAAESEERVLGSGGSSASQAPGDGFVKPTPVKRQRTGGAATPMDISTNDHEERAVRGAKGDGAGGWQGTKAGHGSSSLSGHKQGGHQGGRKRGSDSSGSSDRKSRRGPKGQHRGPRRRNGIPVFELPPGNGDYVMPYQRGGATSKAGDPWGYEVTEDSGRTAENGDPLLFFCRFAVRCNEGGHELRICTTEGVEAFTVLHIVGRVALPFVDKKGMPPVRTHLFKHTDEIKGFVDGSPTDYETENCDAPCYGLGVAMIINVPPEGRAPNCRFIGNVVIIMENLGPGEELLMFHHPSSTKGLGAPVSDMVLDIKLPNPCVRKVERDSYVEHHLSILRCLDRGDSMGRMQDWVSGYTAGRSTRTEPRHRPLTFGDEELAAAQAPGPNVPSSPSPGQEAELREIRMVVSCRKRNKFFQYLVLFDIQTEGDWIAEAQLGASEPHVKEFKRLNPVLYEATMRGCHPVKAKDAPSIGAAAAP